MYVKVIVSQTWDMFLESIVLTTVKIVSFLTVINQILNFNSYNVELHVSKIWNLHS